MVDTERLLIKIHIYMKAVIFAVDPKSTSRSLMYLFLHQCRLTCPYCRGVPPREQDVHPPLADPTYRLLICLFPILWHPLSRTEETAAQTRSSAPSPPAYSALPFSCLLPATKALPLPDVSLYAGPREGLDVCEAAAAREVAQITISENTSAYIKLLVNLGGRMRTCLRKLKALFRAMKIKEKKVNEVLLSYSTYVYKVLKHVCSDMGISSKAKSIMNSFLYYILKCISGKASYLACSTSCSNVNSREI
eukprot:bmy_21127T0